MCIPKVGGPRDTAPPDHSNARIQTRPLVANANRAPILGENRHALFGGTSLLGGRSLFGIAVGIVDFFSRILASSPPGRTTTTTALDAAADVASVVTGKTLASSQADKLLTPEVIQERRDLQEKLRAPLTYIQGEVETGFNWANVATLADGTGVPDTRHIIKKMMVERLEAEMYLNPGKVDLPLDGIFEGNQPTSLQKDIREMNAMQTGMWRLMTKEVFRNLLPEGAKPLPEKATFAPSPNMHPYRFLSSLFFQDQHQDRNYEKIIGDQLKETEAKGFVDTQLERINSALGGSEFRSARDFLEKFYAQSLGEAKNAGWNPEDGTNYTGFPKLSELLKVFDHIERGETAGINKINEEVLMVACALLQLHAEGLELQTGLLAANSEGTGPDVAQVLQQLTNAMKETVGGEPIGAEPLRTTSLFDTLPVFASLENLNTNKADKLDREIWSKLIVAGIDSQTDEKSQDITQALMRGDKAQFIDIGKRIGLAEAQLEQQWNAFKNANFDVPFVIVQDAPQDIDDQISVGMLLLLAKTGKLKDLTIVEGARNTNAENRFHDGVAFPRLYVDLFPTLVNNNAQVQWRVTHQPPGGFGSQGSPMAAPIKAAHERIAELDGDKQTIFQQVKSEMPENPLSMEDWQDILSTSCLICIGPFTTLGEEDFNSINTASNPRNER